MAHIFPSPHAERPDLGAQGVVAILVPAENPTAEPELATLLPPDVNVLTARMYAPGPDMLERLRRYEQGLEEWLQPFGDAPLDAVAFACTGSTYLISPEQRRQGPLIRASGPCPVVCAADALERGLASLGAKRIALVSPYPAALTEPAAAYWSSRGFEVRAVIQSPVALGGHPIYSQTAATLLEGLRQGIAVQDIDAVVAMGTGAPSLPALAVASLDSPVPILSSNLATAWAITQELTPGAEHPVIEWLSETAPWRERLWSRFPTVRRRLLGA